jgi:2-keto-4-pentenoate hydratase
MTAARRHGERQHTAPPLTETEAYAVQQQAVDAALAAGRAVAGYKIGLTTLAAQRAFSTDHPAFGVLFTDMIATAAPTLPSSAYVVPRLEPEIAFVFGSGLAGSGLTAEDVLAAATRTLPAVEIADSRYGRWDVSAIDLICDNGFAAGALLPPSGGQWSAGSTGWSSCRVRRNGTVVAAREATDAAAVRAQAAWSVVWLADVLATSGRRIPPGALVLSGALTDAIDVVPGDHLQIDFDDALVFDIAVV